VPVGEPHLVGAFLLLASAICVMGASFVVCYMIWSAGWEGWEAWNARTGLNESEALSERHKRLMERTRK
jgi:hypothetical protein